MKILILTLTGQRDKLIDNMIGDELRKFGHEVYVHNYINAGKQSVPYIKPDVVVHPFPGGKFKMDFIKQCHEWGCKVVIRRGEAGVSREIFDAMDEDRQTLIIGNWDYSPYTDIELVWGEEFKKLLYEVYGWMPNGKVKACGAFAFDPYFLPTCKRNDNYGGKKTILFATGFSTADCRVEYCECGLPEDSKFHKEIYELHRRGRDLWIETIKELHKWFSDEFDFELKVRPGEMTGEYIEKLSGIVKIHPQVSPSSEVLKGVDFLVHTGSTMAIEAHLLGIPSVNFFNVNPDKLLASVSPIANDYKELEWILRQTSTQQSNINERVLFQLEEHLYGKIDGLACQRAAQSIHFEFKDGVIETNIPDKWPAIPMYHEDKETVHLEKQDGDISWLCPCCKERFYAGKDIKLAKCPYDGLMIALVDKKSGTTVLNPVGPTVEIKQAESVLK